MNRLTAYLAIALLCLVLAACSQAESKNASGPADNVIGIVQCDDYLAAVNTCLPQVPDDKRAALTSEAHRMFVTWKEAAADPKNRLTLPQACSITHEVAKEELAGYGCKL